MKNFSYLLIPSLMFLAFACQKADPKDDDKGGTTAKLEISLQPKTQDPGLSKVLSWNKGETFGIYSAQFSNGANYPVSIGTGDVLKTDMSVDNSTSYTFYVYAPYNQTGSISNKNPQMEVVLAGEQKAETSPSDNSYVYGTISSSDIQDAKASLKVEHLFAYASFNVSSDLSGYKLKSVSISSANTNICGSASVDLKAGQKLSITKGEKTVNSVFTNQPTVGSSAQAAFVTFFPLQNASLTATVDLEKDGMVKRFKKEFLGVNMTAGTLTEFTLSTSQMAEAKELDIDFGKSSVISWGGLVSITHSDIAVLENGVRIEPESYGIKYRIASSSDSWVSVTAVDGKSATASLTQGATYEYKVWVSYGGKEYEDTNIGNFTSGVDSENFLRRSIVFKFTGTWCHNCPNMTDIITAAQPMVDNRITTLELHAQDEFEVESFSTLSNLFKVTGYPTGVVDGRGEIPNSSVSVMAPVLANMVKESVASYPSVVGVTFGSSLDGRKVNIDLNLYVKATDSYIVNVLLVEDRSTTSQSGYEGTYQMHNIARVLVNGVSGEKFEAKAGTVFTKSYSANLTGDAVINASKVLVYVQRKYSNWSSSVKKVTGVTYNNYNDYYVDNCAVAAIGSNAVLEYEK